MANAEHLELARLGRDAWNKWRRENPDEPANFSGIDFTAPENQDICFAEFEFGPGANFSHTKFGDLPEGLLVNSAEQIPEVLQQDMVSGAVAVFIGATFGDEANFQGATFGDAHFDAQSQEHVKEILEQWLLETDGTVSGTANHLIRKRIETAWQEAKRDPTGFRDIRFKHARFRGSAYFVNRNFGGEADFAHVRFDQPPDFLGTKGHDNLNWTKVRFGFRGVVRFDFRGRTLNIPTPGWTTDDRVGARLRRLRKIATDILALDAERNLLILQRMAERGILWNAAWCLWKTA